MFDRELAPAGRVDAWNPRALRELSTPKGNIMRQALTLCAVLVAAAAFGAGTAAAEGGNPEYERAVETTRRMAEDLQTYDVRGTLEIESRVEGKPEPMKLEVALKGAARWPDRLLSSQDSPAFSLNLGLGADQSWFYLGQAGAAYMGGALELRRSLDGAAQMELEEEKIFNFYAGIASFLLSGGVSVEPETGSETLTVGDRQIPCQVFHSIPGPAADPAGGPQDGEQTYWFDPESGLVLQAVMRSHAVQQGKKVEQTLRFRVSHFELNKPVAEELFNYKPAAGVRVVPSLDRVLNPESMAGEQAADVTFTDLDGNEVRLADYRGKVVFLDFWATWCGPCRMEMPHIQKLHEELGTDGEVVFIGASSEPKPTITQFLAKNAYTFKIVMVKQEDAQKKFNVSSIPAGFVIDREGVIRAHLIGAQTEQQLRKALSRAGLDL